MAQGAAIVTTLKNAGAVIDSFIAYHLAIGFERLYLFFDDPRDADLARLSGHPSLECIPHDEKLRTAWLQSPLHQVYGAHVEREVMARQSLNVAIAMERARDAGLGWLLHIDADELFYSPRQSVRAHFASVPSAVETIVYKNCEAVPERDDIGDFFRETRLFKIPPGFPFARAYPLEALHDAIQRTPQLAPNFFHFYNSGKAAVRLDAESMAPSGVHAFARPSGKCVSAASAQQFILHYACCGFDHFWTKYATLGRFGDKWFETHDIAAHIGPFHLQARDVVIAGDREVARAFYRNRMAIENPAVKAPLIDAGILGIIPEPGDILEKARL